MLNSLRCLEPSLSLSIEVFEVTVNVFTACVFLLLAAYRIVVLYLYCVLCASLRLWSIRVGRYVLASLADMPNCQASYLIPTFRLGSKLLVSCVQFGSRYIVEHQFFYETRLSKAPQ